jgi:uncharacterized phage protein (TIGR01671 family)
MRKIKAWDETNKVMRMVEELTFDKDGTIHGCVHEEEGDDLGRMYMMGKPVEVKGQEKPDHIILIQHIGLFDRHKKEIYEGDIIGFIRRHDLLRFVVEFHYGMFTPRYITTGTIKAKHRLHECTKEGISLTGMPRNILTTNGSPWEIIGNRFENPELLNP